MNDLLIPQAPAADPSAPHLEQRVREVFDRQLATALRLRSSTARERIAKIRKLRDCVMAHQADLYAAGEADFHRPAPEMDMTELAVVQAEARDAMRHLKRWMRPHKVWPTFAALGTRAHVRYEPRGRCLIISPWNYPLNLTFGPLVSAIAAGNTAIIKPSELTPRHSALIVKIVAEVFQPDEVAVFEGDAAVSTALLALPFDHIFFTGSPAIGKVVMAAAAKHLTSVTLELGGKSPTIIDESADLTAAARNICWGKFTNAGQTCIAPDYIYVHESVHDRFVAKLREAVVAAYGESPQAQAANPDLAHVVNSRHVARLSGLLNDAVQRGAKTVCGNVVAPEQNFIAPTVLTDVPPGSTIMREEIFGPLLPVLRYSHVDDAIAAINAQPKPLALYIWSRDRARTEHILQNTTAGGTCINSTVQHFLHGNLPFGGVNNSGQGNAHGFYGFRAFSHERAVLKSQISLLPMYFPPFTALKKLMVRLLLRFI
jgi:aldehyde dehydrogenase (NAD+)